MKDELVALERGFWDAAGDGSFYTRNMAVDGRCLFPEGTLDRDACIAAADEATPWTTVAMSALEVHMPQDGVAVLTYDVRAERAGQPPYHALVGSTYVRADSGRWLLLTHQQTPPGD